jgi:amidophosphoribosyltransferase
MRISSPPMRFPCFMGVDIGSTKELIAFGRTADEVRERIGADSLHYLSIPGLMRAIGRGTSQEFCRACFDGSYPVPVPQQLEMDKMQFELSPSHGVPAESQDSVGKKSDHVPGPPSPQLVG